MASSVDRRLFFRICQVGYDLFSMPSACECRSCPRYSGIIRLVVCLAILGATDFMHGRVFNAGFPSVGAIATSLIPKDKAHTNHASDKG
jgi:hypothetical protein